MSAAVRLMHCIEQVIRGINVPKWSIIPRYARLFPRTSVARRRLAIIVGTRPAAESIAECLRKCGVEARISPSAVELFEHGRDFKPDLIVSDLALGDISAIEAGSDQKACAQLRCVVLFGCSFQSIPRRAIADIRRERIAPTRRKCCMHGTNVFDNGVISRNDG